MFPFGKTGFSLKAIEKQNDALKECFIKQGKAFFLDEQYYQHDGTYSFRDKTGKSFREALHFVDLNNDGLDDIIYTGYSGGEGTEVAILLNTTAEFKMLFKQQGDIINLEFKDKKLFRIATRSYPCCMDYLYFNRIYEVKHVKNNIDFKLVYLTSYTEKTVTPKSYFTKPVYFEVLNNGYKMRSGPKIDDTTKNNDREGGKGLIGNNIDTLNKGTRGRAIATQTDNTGRVWWLVEIDRGYLAYGNLFYEQNNNKKETASKMGWISSRFVKTIDK
jgi:hypothetical protein